jgi:hypothetical protein
MGERLLVASTIADQIKGCQEVAGIGDAIFETKKAP